MCRIKAQTIDEGLISSEKVVRIRTVDGTMEEFTVPAEDVREDTISAFCIGGRNGQVLIEMPRESASGHWRVWLSQDQVVNGR